MRTRHLVLALLVVVIWGLNFVFVKIAMQALPPLTLLLLRFTLSSIPAIFIFRRPKIPISVLLSYGAMTFTLQFAFMFTGIKIGVPPGLASLVVQVQVFFTMGLSIWLHGYRPDTARWLGALVAFGGIGVVALHVSGDVTALGLAFIVLAALCWGVGNLAARRAGAVNPIALVVWGNAVSIGPMLVLALVFEGPSTMVTALASMTPGIVASVAYIIVGSTLVGYTIWSFLMTRYPPSQVAPFTLLVPVVGFLGSMAVFGEKMPPWKLGASALVLAGLGLNLFGGRLFALLTGPVVARDV